MRKNYFVLLIVCMIIFNVGCAATKTKSISKSSETTTIDTKTNSSDIEKSSNNAQEQYLLYGNDRFGFSIEYPSDFVVKLVPDNDDGRIFSSKDGSAELTVSGINNILNENAKDDFDNLVKEHSNASYKHQERNWFVVSWGDGDKIVYEKEVVGRKVINRFIIKYPLSEKKKYDTIITHLNSSFKTPAID